MLSLPPLFSRFVHAAGCDSPIQAILSAVPIADFGIHDLQVLHSRTDAQGDRIWMDDAAVAFAANFGSCLGQLMRALALHYISTTNNELGMDVPRLDAGAHDLAPLSPALVAKIVGTDPRLIHNVIINGVFIGIKLTWEIIAVWCGDMEMDSAKKKATLNKLLERPQNFKIFDATTSHLMAILTLKLAIHTRGGTRVKKSTWTQALALAYFRAWRGMLNGSEASSALLQELHALKEARITSVSAKKASAPSKKRRKTKDATAAFSASSSAAIGAGAGFYTLGLDDGTLGLDGRLVGASAAFYIRGADADTHSLDGGLDIDFGPEAVGFDESYGT